jgi:hypothetical protein
MGDNEGYTLVSCTCGAEFKTYGEYLTHAYAVHGIPASEA